jgi:hypothetical protein
MRKITNQFTRVTAGLASLILWAAAFQATAAPQITDVSAPQGFVHGATITISGQQFGTKSPAKPYLWAPFDGSLAPSPLGIVTSWTANQGMTLAQSEGIIGGAAKGNAGSGPWTLRVDATGFAWNDPNQKLYLHKHVKRTFDVSSVNWKTFRIWSTDFTTPDMYISVHNGSINVEGISNSGGWMYGGDDSKKSEWMGPINQWFTEEYLLKANSSNSSADATFEVFVSGKRVGWLPYTDYSTKTLSLRTSDSQRMIINFPVHFVVANATLPAGSTVWADNVYMDTTWARVMIGNAPTWNASTQREIQIPTAWSSTSLSVVLNQGRLADLRNGYLYVIDANGNVNANGYPLCTTCPKPPGGLR